MKRVQQQALSVRLGLTVGITIIGLSLTLFAISTFLVLSQAARLESELIVRDVQRSMDLFNADTENLAAAVSYFSVWDDSYNFYTTHDPAYITNNFIAETFNKGKLDLALMVGLDGRVLMERVFDSERQDFVALPAGLQAYLVPGSPLLTPNQPTQHVAGILVLPEGLLKVVAQPVTTSRGEGPVRSVMVFGRFLTRKAVGAWADLAHVSLEVRGYNSGDLPADFRQAKTALSADTQAPVLAYSGLERITAYLLVKELSGQPGMIVRIDEPRELFYQSLVSLGLMALSLAVAGLFFGLVARLLIGRLMRSQHDAEKVVARLKAIGELSRSLSVSPGIEKLTRQVLSSLHEITGCYNVNLFLVKGDEIEFLAGEGGYLIESPPVGFRIPRSSGIIGHVASTGQYLMVGDVSRSPYYQYWNGLPTTRSELAIPLRQSGQVIGVLDLQSEGINGFDAADLEALQVLASQLAVALDNSRLYEEARQGARNMESLLNVSASRLQQMESLRTVDLAITASLELDTILQVMLEQVLTHLRVDAASVLLYRPQTQILEYAAKRGFMTDALQHTHLRLGDGFAGRAALEQRVIQIPDLRRQIDTLGRSPLLMQEGFITYLGVPLLVKGQLKGVLEIFQREAFQANEEWLFFLESLSRQTAIAIENASLMEGLEQANAELTAAYDATIEGWALALELRDIETGGHSRRVTDLTLSLAQAMNLAPDELVQLRRGALLHDIGKIGVPDNILKKEGPLDTQEWMIMHRHPQYAYQILSPIPFLRPALDIPYCHHEKWNGSGYPRGLREDQIPLAARIFAVVDVWDAVTHKRYYQDAWPRERAVALLREQAGSHFDAEVVQVFLERVIDSNGYSFA